METVVRNARVTILGQQLMSSKRMNQSIMRRTAFHLHKGTKEDIISKRVVFRWLPVAFSTDVEHGSIWYLWGSMLSVFIPVVPLISLYQKFWHNGYHNVSAVVNRRKKRAFFTFRFVGFADPAPCLRGDILSFNICWNRVFYWILAVCPFV